MSLAHPAMCSEVADGVTQNIVCLFREPDAGNPPVRFDEREEETELSQTGLRRRGESPANRHREATVTAPLLDSTYRPQVISLSHLGAAASFPLQPFHSPSNPHARSGVHAFAVKESLNRVLGYARFAHKLPERETSCSEDECRVGWSRDP